MPVICDYRVTDDTATFEDVRIQKGTTDGSGTMFTLEQDGNIIEMTPEMLSDLVDVLVSLGAKNPLAGLGLLNKPPGVRGNPETKNG